MSCQKDFHKTSKKVFCFVIFAQNETFLNPTFSPPRVLWLQRPLPMATTEGRPVRVQRGRRNSRACEPWAPLMTWRVYGTNPTGGCGSSWLRSGVSTFSFSLFSTNITFGFPHPVFSSWRIRLIYDMLPSVFWKKKKNEEKKKHCQKTILFLIVRAEHARISFPLPSSPDFYFWQVFLSAFVVYFCWLCFYVFTVLML